MKALCIVFILYLILGFIMIVVGGIVVLVQSLNGKYKSDKSNNYNYPYLGFNNPLMDGFE